MTTFMTHVDYADVHAKVPGSDDGTGAWLALNDHQRRSVGRRFNGPDRLSYDCDCPKTLCGLTVFGEWLPGCPFHHGTKTIRQSHSLNACPGREEVA